MPGVGRSAVQGIDAPALIVMFNEIEPLTPFSESQLDQTFDELGYDSLFLLEVLNRLDRERSMVVADGLILPEHTPREALTIIADTAVPSESKAL